MMLAWGLDLPQFNVVVKEEAFNQHTKSKDKSIKKDRGSGQQREKRDVEASLLSAAIAGKSVWFWGGSDTSSRAPALGVNSFASSLTESLPCCRDGFLDTAYSYVGAVDGACVRSIMDQFKETLKETITIGQNKSEEELTEEELRRNSRLAYIVTKLLTMDEHELFTRTRQRRPELQLHETIGMAIQKRIDIVERRRLATETASDPYEGVYIGTVEMGELKDDVQEKLRSQGRPIIVGSHSVAGRSVDDIARSDCHSDPIILRTRARFSHLLIRERVKRGDFDQISRNNRAFQIVDDLKDLRQIPFQKVDSPSDRPTTDQVEDSVYEEQVCNMC